VGKGAAKLLSTHPVVTIAFSKAQRVRLAKARTLKLTIRTRIDVAGMPARYVKQTVTLRR
jgi:hypothetical protein